MPRCKNIDHDLKIIFLHPNRCGGKSIEKILFKRNPIIGSADYNLPEQFIKKFGIDIWNNYFKFGFSRNPWNRVASLYFYRQNNLEWFPFKNLTDYLENGHYEFPLDFITQTRYFFYKNKKIDFVGKVENYTKDYFKITKQLKIIKELPQLNQSKKRLTYQDLFDNKTKKTGRRKIF
jgi:hypothetical protein